MPNSGSLDLRLGVDPGSHGKRSGWAGAQDCRASGLLCSCECVTPTRCSQQLGVGWADHQRLSQDLLEQIVAWHLKWRKLWSRFDDSSQRMQKRRQS